MSDGIYSSPGSFPLVVSLLANLGLLAALAGILYQARRRENELAEKVASRDETLGQVREEKARAEVHVEALRETLTREQEQQKSLQEQVQHTFKSLAASALEGNSQHFLTLAREVLGRESESAKGELEKRQTAIQQLLKPLAEVVDRYQTQVLAMEKERHRAYERVESELKRVIDTSTSLTRETQALKAALKKPHVRGRWGEVQLKNCVELAGMSEYADVEFQATSWDPDGQRLVPDMTVRMPGGRVVYVDAKTPLEAFLDSLEADNEEQRRSCMARHGRHIREHIKNLSQKSYAESLGNSADFTILFLPNESFLYAGLEVEPDLMEFALAKKILIATPPTLIGLLKVIRLGWNEERLAQNAQMISEVGAELHKRIVDFVEAYTSVGKFLDRAKAEYDIGFRRLESRVLVQAQKMAELGAKSHKNLPPLAGAGDVVSCDPAADGEEDQTIEAVDVPEEAVAHRTNNGLRAGPGVRRERGQGERDVRT